MLLSQKHTDVLPNGLIKERVASLLKAPNQAIIVSSGGEKKSPKHQNKRLHLSVVATSPKKRNNHFQNLFSDLFKKAI